MAILREVGLDYNDKYTEKGKKDTVNTKSSGQPSLVYSGVIDINSDAESKLEIIGHGSPDGSDGKIYEGIDGFTTALKIAESVIVRVNK